jgi:hypothetical protein
MNVVMFLSFGKNPPSYGKFLPFDILKAYRDCIQRKTGCMGPFAGVDYISPYLIVNSVVNYPPPLQRERRGGLGKFFFIS